ncbi:MAG: rod shape-determining protein [Candidatus Shapirobacteria bacterium]|nr:rod shape-determining protein [Candidatus Shapirobacteria bacterium]
MKTSWLNEKYRKALSFLSWDIGVDLGSSNILVYLKDKGVVVDEPSMISRQKKKRWTGLSAPKSKILTPIAFGTKAKEMFNKEPVQIEVISPIKNGIISDLEAVQDLISYYLKLIQEIPSKYPKILKSKVIVGVPSSINQVQKRAVKSIFLNAGAREVTLVEEAVLAAVGVGLPVHSSSGLIVVDIGGGKTEVSVISMGGVVVGKGIKVAGIEFDLSIVNYIKMKYGLLIGQNSAEKIKIEIGNVWENSKNEGKTTIIRGRDLEKGLPKSIKITEAEIREAISMDVSKIIKLVSAVLDEAPPELMDDILKKGIILVGNGAKIKGLDRLIEAETKITTRVADEAGLCVIRGCGELIQNHDLLGQIKLITRC